MATFLFPNKRGGFFVTSKTKLNVTHEDSRLAHAIANITDVFDYTRLKVFGKKVVIRDTFEASDFKLILDKHCISYTIQAKIGVGWIFWLGGQKE